MSARNTPENKAKRRAERKARKATFKPTTPFRPNRTNRRHPNTGLSFEPNPNARWKGSKMFAQRKRQTND